MSYKHFNSVVDEPLPFDNATQRYIFLEVCYRADSRGVVRVPQAQLASLTLCSPRTVAREFGRLLELGLLEKETFGRYRVITDASLISQKAPAKTQTLKEWILEEFREKDFLDGEIAIKEEDEEGLPEVAKVAIADGILKCIRKGYLEDGTCVKVFHFNSSGL